MYVTGCLEDKQVGLVCINRSENNVSHNSITEDSHAQKKMC